MSSPFRIRTAAAFAALCAASPALHADDAAAAKKLALNHCGACHSFDAGQPHRQGPNLHGVLDRKAGEAPGFKFSDAFLKALGGKPWDAALLDRWLADPQAVAPGTVMLYRQDDPEKRTALVQFVESLR